MVSNERWLNRRRQSLPNQSANALKPASANGVQDRCAVPLSSAPGPDTALIHCRSNLVNAAGSISNDVLDCGDYLIRVSIGFLDHRLVTGGLSV